MKSDEDEKTEDECIQQSLLGAFSKANVAEADVKIFNAMQRAYRWRALNDDLEDRGYAMNGYYTGGAYTTINDTTVLVESQMSSCLRLLWVIFTSTAGKISIKPNGENVVMYPLLK
jgi:hypothetical protein